MQGPPSPRIGRSSTADTERTCCVQGDAEMDEHERDLQTAGRPADEVCMFQTSMSSCLGAHRNSQQTLVAPISDDKTGVFEVHEATMQSSRLCDLNHSIGQFGWRWVLPSPRVAVLAALGIGITCLYWNGLASSTLAFLGLAGVLATLAWELCFQPHADAEEDSEKGIRPFSQRYYLAAVIAVGGLGINAMRSVYLADGLLGNDVSLDTGGTPEHVHSIIPTPSSLSTTENVYFLKLVVAAVLAGAALWKLRTRALRTSARSTFSAFASEAGMDAAGATRTLRGRIPASSSELLRAVLSIEPGPVRVSALTLAFSPAPVEQLYLEQQRAQSGELHARICSVGIVVCAVAVVVSPQEQLLGVAGVGFYTSLLAARAALSVGHGDHSYHSFRGRSVWSIYQPTFYSERAEVLFGRCWVVASTLLATVLCALHSRLEEQLDELQHVHQQARHLAQQLAQRPTQQQMEELLQLQLQMYGQPGGQSGAHTSRRAVSIGCWLLLAVALPAQMRLTAVSAPHARAAKLCAAVACQCVTWTAAAGTTSEAGALSEAADRSCGQVFLWSTLALLLGELLSHLLIYGQKRAHIRFLSAFKLRAQADKQVADAAAAALGEQQTHDAQQQAQTRHDDANRMADSRLNHVIKGHCGTAVSSLHTFVEMLPQYLSVPLPERVQRLLVAPIEQLGSVIQWCDRRQMLIRQAQGTYVSVLSRVDVRAMLEAAVGDDGRVLVLEADRFVSVDQDALAMVVEEALDNARRHGEAGTVVVEASCAQGVLTVTIRNDNREGVPSLSPAEIERMLRPGERPSTVSTMNDGLGLHSIAEAVRRVQGAVNLTAERVGERETTCLHLTLPTERRTVRSCIASVVTAASGPVSPASFRARARAATAATAAATSGSEQESEQESEQNGVEGYLEGCVEDRTAEQGVLAASADGMDVASTEVQGEQRSGWGVLDAFEERADVAAAALRSVVRPEAQDAAERSAEAVDASLDRRAKSELWSRPAAQARAASLDLLSPTFDMAICPTPSRGPSSYWQHRLEGVCSSGEEARSSSAAGWTGSRELKEEDEDDEGNDVGNEAAVGRVDDAMRGEEAHACTSPPYCLGLGARRRSRALQSALFERFLHADMARSAALGAREEESHMFVYAALGLLGPDLKAVPAGRQGRHADLVLLDESLGSMLDGADFASELRASGFKGVVCMLASKDSTQDERHKSNEGEGSPGALASASTDDSSVDVTFAPDATLAEMAARIRPVLEAKRAAAATSATSPVPRPSADAAANRPFVSSPDDASAHALAVAAESQKARQPSPGSLRVPLPDGCTPLPGASARVAAPPPPCTTGAAVSPALSHSSAASSRNYGVSPRHSLGCSLSDSPALSYNDSPATAPAGYRSASSSSSSTANSFNLTTFTSACTAAYNPSYTPGFSRSNRPSFPPSPSLREPSVREPDPSNNNLLSAPSFYDRSPLSPPLLCVAMDDEDVPRMMLEVLIENYLGADMRRSCSMGGSLAQQRAFVDVALGKRDINLNPVSSLDADARHADIAILDQNINLDCSPPILGSELIKELRALGFNGLTCIVTGDSRERVAQLAKEPDIDIVIEKGMPLPQLAHLILRHRRVH